MRENQNLGIPSDRTLQALLHQYRGRREQRGHKRHVALLRVAPLHARGSKELCVVRNISPGGLSARVYRKLAGGEHVEVEFRSGERLSGNLVWERDWEVGITFPKLIDVDAVLASRWVTESGRGRSLPRIQIDCRGQLKMGARSFDVVLQEISQGGAKVQTQTPITDGGGLILSFAGSSAGRGVFRWVGGTEGGISFNKGIPFERLARWIQTPQRRFKQDRRNAQSRGRMSEGRKRQRAI